MANPTYRTEPARTVSDGVLRGVIGGLIGGAFFMGLAMWFANTTGGPFYRPLVLVSDLVLDAGGTATTTAIAVGSAIHVGLSVAFGALFGALVARFRSNRSLALAGFGFGALLYFVNIVLLGDVTGTFEATGVFESFSDVNGPLVFAAHILYGVSLSSVFLGPEHDAGRAVPATIEQRDDTRERVST